VKAMRQALLDFGERQTLSTMRQIVPLVIDLS
jgi:hypothetical protein